MGYVWGWCCTARAKNTPLPPLVKYLRKQVPRGMAKVRPAPKVTGSSPRPNLVVLLQCLQHRLCRNRRMMTPFNGHILPLGH
jgi:hypothetical protein